VKNSALSGVPDACAVKAAAPRPGRRLRAAGPTKRISCPSASQNVSYHSTLSSNARQKVSARGRFGARGRRRIAPSSGSVAKLVSTPRRRGRSATQNAAGGLFHRRDDALADRVDLLVGEGFFARLQG